MEYQEQKEAIIELLKQGEHSIRDISKITGVNWDRVHTFVYNIKNEYDVAKRRIKTNTLYKIIGKLDKEKLVKIYDVTELHNPVSKNELLDWSIHNTTEKFPTSKDLVAYAKGKGLKVYELKNDGKRYFL